MTLIKLMTMAALFISGFTYAEEASISQAKVLNYTHYEECPKYSHTNIELLMCLTGGKNKISDPLQKYSKYKEGGLYTDGKKYFLSRQLSDINQSIILASLCIDLPNPKVKITSDASLYLELMTPNNALKGQMGVEYAVFCSVRDLDLAKNTILEIIKTPKTTHNSKLSNRVTQYLLYIEKEEQLLKKAENDELLLRIESIQNKFDAKQEARIREQNRLAQKRVSEANTYDLKSGLINTGLGLAAGWLSR